MMNRTYSPTKQFGFSLVEMAVVLMILGILLSGVLVAVGDSTDSIRISNARTQLESIEEALYGFAQANGRLPCPATNTSDGEEAPVGGGACTNNFGLLPNVTLGLFGAINEDGLLLDPWQNPYRYAVSPYTTIGGGLRAFTTSAGMQELFDDNELAAGANMIRVCNINDCSDITLSDTVPAIVVSMGDNWAISTSVNETENSIEATMGAYNVPNDITFGDTEYNETTCDDELRWLSPHILFSRLIQAGQLP